MHGFLYYIPRSALIAFGGRLMVLLGVQKWASL